MKFKSGVFFLITLIFAISMFGCANNSNEGTTSSSDKQKITLVLDYTPNTNHLGLYVAKEKGYFADEGLEVEIVSPPEDGADSLVASGQAQFGISFQDWMATYAGSSTPLPVTAIAAILQHNTSSLLSLKSSNISSPKDLAGKTYASMDNATELAILNNLVESDGGNFSSVKTVSNSASNEVQGLSTNLFNCVWSYDNWGVLACKRAGLDISTIRIASLNSTFDYYTPVIIGSNDFMSNNPDITRKFLTAVKKGYEYSVANPEDAASILCTADPSLDEGLVQDSARMLADEFIADASSWGIINEDRWSKFWEWINEQGLTEKPLSTREYFTNEYLLTTD